MGIFQLACICVYECLCASAGVVVRTHMHTNTHAYEIEESLNSVLASETMEIFYKVPCIMNCAKQ